MIPTSEDPSVYLGDVYILQDNVIMGLIGGIKFRRYPRLLMNRFFSAPDSAIAKSYATNSDPLPAVTRPESAPVAALPPKMAPLPSAQKATVTVTPLAALASAEVIPPPAQLGTAPAAVVIVGDSNSTTRNPLVQIATEARLDVADLKDEAPFADLGIDSLMSLVIAERFREDLGISVAGSLFLEYPTIGALRVWLEEYYG